MDKYELTADSDMTENIQYWKFYLKNDGEDWPTKMWRWSVNPHPAELNSEHNACAAEYPFTNFPYPTEFSLGY